MSGNPGKYADKGEGSKIVKILRTSFMDGLSGATHKGRLRNLTVFWPPQPPPPVSLAFYKQKLTVVTAFGRPPFGADVFMDVP